MRFVILISFIIMVLAGIVMGWYAAHPTPNVGLGQTLYAQHCAQCHGAKLEGQTADWRMRDENGFLPAPPHDATGHTWHHSDQQLFGIVKFGTAKFAPEGYNTNMLGFGHVLSDNDIWSILNYIKSTWPPEIQARQQSISLPR